MNSDEPAKSSVRGRKPKTQHATKKPVLFTRITPELHARIVEYCQDEDISLNQYVTSLIEDDLYQ